MSWALCQPPPFKPEYSLTSIRTYVEVVSLDYSGSRVGRVAKDRELKKIFLKVFTKTITKRLFNVTPAPCH